MQPIMTPRVSENSRRLVSICGMNDTEMPPTEAPKPTAPFINVLVWSFIDSFVPIIRIS